MKMPLPQNDVAASSDDESDDLASAANAAFEHEMNRMISMHNDTDGSSATDDVAIFIREDEEK